jgi:queuine tRNA-ribosyltransferase
VFVLDKTTKSVKTLKIQNARFKQQVEPISETCDCYSCQNNSAALLYHLAKTNDTAVGALLTIHNVRVMEQLCDLVKEDILMDKL